jgi:anti-sigma B factor antagonist
VDNVPAIDVTVDGPRREPLVHISGEIDVATAPVVRERLAALLEDGAQRITLDLDRVAFIDSSGLGVLVGALRRMHEHGGELSIEGAQPGVRKILEITGLAEVFALGTR